MESGGVGGADCGDVLSILGCSINPEIFLPVDECQLGHRSPLTADFYPGWNDAKI
jgi:hypothetical protein